MAQNLSEHLLYNEDLLRFEKSWLKNTELDENLIRENYAYLREIGFTNDYLTRNPHVLTLNSYSLISNIELLRGIGLTNKEISKNEQLIGRDPKNLKTKYKFLIKKRLTEKEIINCVHLLSLSLDTLKGNYRFLRKEIGLTGRKINLNPSLLGNNHETIKRNYQHLIHLGLSEQDISTHPQFLKFNPQKIKEKYQRLRDFFEKEFILEIPSILGNNVQTIEANIGYLNSIGVDFNTYKFLLCTSPQTKRKKLSYLLREVFDYRNLSEEQKKIAMKKVYELVRRKTILLVQSEENLEGKIERLKKEILSL